MKYVTDGMTIAWCVASSAEDSLCKYVHIEDSAERFTHEVACFNEAVVWHPMFATYKGERFLSDEEAQMLLLEFRARRALGE